MAAYILRFNTLKLFFVGYVYAEKPAFEDKIEAFIREIPAEILKRICQNWTQRMDHLRRSRGQDLHEIIFKH